MESVAAVPQSVTRDLSQLRQATGKVVGNVFFGSMLKMMRDSKIKGTLGHGGRGEEVFSGQLHGILSERMGERTHGGVVDTLFKQLERQQRLISERRENANAVESERDGKSEDVRSVTKSREASIATRLGASPLESAK